MLRKALFVASALVLATFASEARACRWLSRHQGMVVCETATCPVVTAVSVVIELRIKKLEVIVAGIQIPADQSQTISGLRAEIVELRTQLEELRGRKIPVDLTDEVDRLKGRVTVLETLVARVTALEGRADAQGGKITALESTVSSQGERISTLESTVATLSEKLERHLNPPPPPASDFIPWETIVVELGKLGVDLNVLFQKTENLYRYRYAAKYGIKNYALQKPRATASELEYLAENVRQGKALVIIDTTVCLEQHINMISFAVPGITDGIEDLEPLFHPSFIAVVVEKPSIREAVLSILLKFRSEFSIETRQGLVFKKPYGSWIAVPRP